MASDRQAREHSLLTMRVKQIIVVVNKMDDVNYSKNQFENVKGKLPNLQSVIYLFQWVGRR
jgi:translation elongation factor EF-1alpha